VRLQVYVTQALALNDGRAKANHVKPVALAAKCSDASGLYRPSAPRFGRSR